jgi:glycosyltransferase involved in cell wall biosynthesis
MTMSHNEADTRRNRDQDLHLSLVVPLYNEAACIGKLIERIHRAFNEAPSIRLELVFVNDGSIDSTLDRLLEEQRKDARIKIIDLSRNFGKEAALTAGLEIAAGQVIVPIDADLQDPPELIMEMIEKWREGFDVVLARRIDRTSDMWLKRFTASAFYRVHNKISDYDLPTDVGDFRLMDRRVIDALRKMPESRRFMKGLFSWVGFRTTSLDYTREERVAGSTKFNAWRLWNFALEGLTSFSTAPLRIWLYVGSLVALFSFFFALYIIIKVIISGIDVPGYASVMVAVTFLGGIQLIGIGILGEYLGRTYIETKNRPVYIVRGIYTARED